MAVRPSVFFFFNLGNQGWTERYWYVPEASTLPPVAASGALLLSLRVACLARNVNVPWAYASFDDEFRDVRPIPIPAKQSIPAGDAWNVGIQVDALEANACIILRMSSGDRSGKYIYLSGCGFSAGRIATTTYEPVLTVSQRDAINAFIVGLTPVWGWKGKNYAPGAAPLVPITTMVAGASSWTATVTDGTTFAIGKKAKLTEGVFSGLNGTRANRVYLVTAKAGNVLTLSWGDTDLTGAAYIGQGKLQAQVDTILPFTDGRIFKTGSRKRGVGFGRPHGRRRVSRCP